MATITNKPRYRVEDAELDHKIHWSNKIWVSNLFRAYEWLFGRGFGIRKEAASYIDSNGKVHHVFYTLEAFLSHYEGELRSWLGTFRYLFYPSFEYQIYQMAIALDVASNSTASGATPFTFSHTSTGSNLLLIVGVGVGNSGNGTQPAVSSVTYNSISMVEVRNDQNADGSLVNFVESSLWFLFNPTTGANTVSISWTNNSLGKGVGGAVSYSGAQQSNTADAVNGLVGSAKGSQTFNVTTVANNCWVICVGITGHASPTLTAANTQRWNVLASSPALAIAGEDTNGPKTPAGAVSVGWTIADTFTPTWAMSGASFAPAGGAVQYYSALSTVGVG